MNLPLFGRMVSRGGATLALAGTLALCAACGGGGGTEGTASPDAGATPAVSGEVQVTEEEAVAEAETPAAEATPERRAPQVRSVGRVRDPFVNPTVSAVEAPPQVPTSTPTTAAPASGAASAQGAASTQGPASAPGQLPGQVKAPTKPVMPQPDVVVTGVVRSARGNRAILRGPEGPEIVVVGQKLGEFVVSAIDVKGVTLSWKGHRVQVPFEREVFSLKSPPVPKDQDDQKQPRTRRPEPQGRR